MGLIDCRSPSSGSTCDGCQKEQPRKLKIFKLQELARATESFSQQNILGKGSHSCVYKAVLNNGDVVAVKRPTLARRTLQDAISFDNELDILSNLRHRHLVNMIGFCNESHEKLLVVEFMENGTLYDVLHCRDEPLGWSARMHMALQAAKAIHALHSASPPIIHRDVKSSNILIDRNWNAKLSDLGLALRGQLNDVARKGGAPPAGTMGYIDPAYETPSQLSSKSDVFSFGILLLEIMSGRKAIDVRFDPSSLMDWAVPLIRQGKALDVCDRALRPPQDSDVVQQLASIAARSVRQSRDRRPTMAEVVQGLQRIRKKLPSPRFGDKPPRRPQIAVPKGEVGEDSISISTEGPPQINSSSLTKARKAEVGRDDSGKGASSSNRDALLIHEGKVGPRRIDISRPTTVQEDEVGREDSEGDASISNWDALSIQDERGVSEEPNSISGSDSGRSWNSHDYENGSGGSRRGWRLDGNGEGRVLPAMATTQASSSSSAVRVPAISKPESPIFDPSSAPTIISSPLKVDMIRNLAASSPISPLAFGSPIPTANNGVVGRNINTRRYLETPTFGSKGLLIPRMSMTAAAPEWSTLGTDSSSGSEFHHSRERESIHSQRDVQLGSLGSLLEWSGQVPPKRNSKDTRETQQLSRSSSKPRVQLESSRSLREGSRSQVAPKRNNKDIRETQPLLSSSSNSSNLHVQFASQRSLEEGSSGRVPPKWNKDTRETQPSSSAKPHVQLPSQRPPPREGSSNQLREGSSGQVTTERNSRDIREKQQPSTSFCEPPPRGSGRAATQKSKSYRESEAESNDGSVTRPTVSFRKDVVVPIWDAPEPAVKFYTNAEAHFEKVDLPIAV